MITLERQLNHHNDNDNDNDSSSHVQKHGSEVHAVNHGADNRTPKDRDGIRSRYLAVTNMIIDEGDEIAKPDSVMFDLIFDEMERLHQLVTKPREQVADAKALLEITQSLGMAVKTIANGGPTPSDFVAHILKNFGGQGGPSNSTADCSRVSVAWKDIGVAVSHVFRGVYGCSTMIGPMDATINQKTFINRRKRVRPTEFARPEELSGDSTEERNETDKIMLTMFNILRINKVVKLENLVLNRNSFAQTVENLFALSCLVKDGRAEIKVNEAGWQLVSPRNAPSANAVLSKDVSFSHFVFRFDFKDWKLMVRTVGTGEELMPHRNSESQSPSAVPAESPETMPTTTKAQETIQ